MLSIVVPVLNEVQSLPQLRQEITQTCEKHGLDVDLIFVDDGSTDASWNVIKELSESDDRVSGIRFRRNFGKAAALTAGIRAAGAVHHDAGRRFAGRPGGNSTLSGEAGRGL